MTGTRDDPDEALLAAVREGWGWSGLDPVRLLMQSPFGNLAVFDREGRVWRVCPEELCVTLLAEDAAAFAGLARDPAFQADWAMAALAAEATARYGAPPPGACFGFAIPCALGGGYGLDNVRLLPLAECVACSGDLARQIDGLPDGTEVELVIKP